MIWADLGRAVLLGSIPVAALGGWLSLPQVFLVAALAAVLTTFFDVADKAYLPTVVRARGPRAGERRAGRDRRPRWSSPRSASPASSCKLPDGADRDRSSTRSRSSCPRCSWAAIRRPEPPPPPAADREPILAEIREGLAARRARPGAARAAVGDDGPVGDVGRLRGDVAAVRDRRAAGSTRRSSAWSRRSAGSGRCWVRCSRRGRPAGSASGKLVVVVAAVRGARATC